MKKITQTLIAALFFCGIASAQQQLAERPKPVVETTEEVNQQEKLMYEMVGLMKSSGFEAEQIDAYIELTKKTALEMAGIQNNAKLKDADKDLQRKRNSAREEEQLKKIFAGERYEKFLELRKQVYGEQEMK